MLRKEAGDTQGIFAMAFHTKRQRLHATDDEISLERAEDSAGHVLQTKHLALGDKVLSACNHAGDDIAVAV